jgi:alkylation response protein AidB-like acyl-CoA dehydrogenase
MSAGQRAALELTESARESFRGSFASRLFMGDFDFSAIYPFPAQSAEERLKGDQLLSRLEPYLREHVDPEEIDRSGEIPQEVISELARMGCFGIKIPSELGGLGFSQTNYSRVAMLLGSWCGNTTALVSAHQSIGVPQSLLMFGSPEQKKKYLPRVAKGEISAFALTEADAGSDPASLSLRAEPSADGQHYILNGEKLWCTNGYKAALLIVIARTPDKVDNGKKRKQLSAFVVPTNAPGVKIERRCHFMGLRSLYNAVISFTNVKVPAEDLVGGEGKGLKLALSTLNIGRLTIPAACVGVAKRCLDIATSWAASRVQWGGPIGKHAAIAGKIAEMAANVFAMEAMVTLSSGLVDRKNYDIRLEAAMCKLWCTEMTWQIADDALQIRGGRGYETAYSLKARGEEPVGIERILRDARINRIFEGSTEIMYLFISREALDRHLKIGGAVVNSQLPLSTRLTAAVKAGAFYSLWYPKLWFHLGVGSVEGLHPTLEKHLSRAARSSRCLAASLFHNMAWYGPKLESRQLLLARFVNVATEIFAQSCVISYAQHLLDSGHNNEQTLQVADYFCHSSQRRVRAHFSGICDNVDRRGYDLAQNVLKIKFDFLKSGIVRH